uniref:Uncharacterized protein n=1 Tax=Arundo donax TaxID=35708 RepID=A0A0A9AFG0_ARUDO
MVIPSSNSSNSLMNMDYDHPSPEIWNEVSHRILRNPSRWWIQDTIQFNRADILIKLLTIFGNLGQPPSILEHGLAEFM